MSSEEYFGLLLEGSATSREEVIFPSIWLSFLSRFSINHLQFPNCQVHHYLVNHHYLIFQSPFNWASATESLFSPNFCRTSLYSPWVTSCKIRYFCGRTSFCFSEIYDIFGPDIHLVTSSKFYYCCCYYYVKRVDVLSYDKNRGVMYRNYEGKEKYSIIWHGVPVNKYFSSIFASYGCKYNHPYCG